MSNARFVRVWSCPSCHSPQRDPQPRTLDEIDADTAPRRCAHCGKLVSVTIPSEIECSVRKIGTPLPT